MADSQTIQSDFRRYASLIESSLGLVPFSPSVEDVDSLQVERGIVFPSALLSASDFSSIDRLLELSTSPRLSTMRVIDASRHHRPVYRPLLIHSALSAFQLQYEKLPQQDFGRWEEGLRAWCDLLEAELGRMMFPGALPASQGAHFAEAAWIALALSVAGKIYIRDAWTDLAGDVFGKFAKAQQSSGAFLQSTSSDNPETHWYHELTILHAAASFAVQMQDRPLSAAVARATRFHQNETQPDHASQQPWGIFAFIWNAETRPLADQVLHSATVNAPTARDPISLMLLADALYCLRLFL